MKNILLAITFLFSINAVAGNDLYLVEPMICSGTIKQKPKGMDPSHYNIMLKLTSLKSVRKDGTLAPGLNWQELSAPTGAGKPQGDSVGWLMGPLRVSNNTVYRKNVSGRDDNLVLRITNSTSTPQGRIDTLVGSYDLVGTVVGNYGYNLTCQAVVVKDTKWVINQTKR